LAGIHEFGFAVDLTTGQLRSSAEANEWRIADSVDDGGPGFHFSGLLGAPIQALEMGSPKLAAGRRAIKAGPSAILRRLFRG
jgi:hypothetical protein